MNIRGLCILVKTLILYDCFYNRDTTQFMYSSGWITNQNHEKPKQMSSLITSITMTETSCTQYDFLPFPLFQPFSFSFIAKAIQTLSKINKLENNRYKEVINIHKIKDNCHTYEYPIENTCKILNLLNICVD